MSAHQSGGPCSPDRLRQATAAARALRLEQAASGSDGTDDSDEEIGHALLFRRPELGGAGRSAAAPSRAAGGAASQQPSATAQPSSRQRAGAASEQEEEEESPFEAQGEQLLRLRAVLELTRRSFLLDLMSAMIDEQQEVRHLAVAACSGSVQWQRAVAVRSAVARPART